ncbi:MAG TPA: hypothetical protein PK006_10400 [Saprospiraceae bacterium]|nr:hypothetical protein [Saprospiraceae bacterium]
MKPILTMMALSIWSFVAWASDTTIVFQKMKYADLFQQAKKRE